MVSPVSATSDSKELAPCVVVLVCCAGLDCCAQQQGSAVSRSLHGNSSGFNREGLSGLERKVRRDVQIRDGFADSGVASL